MTLDLTKPLRPIEEFNHQYSPFYVIGKTSKRKIMTEDKYGNFETWREEELENVPEPAPELKGFVGVYLQEYGLRIGDVFNQPINQRNYSTYGPDIIIDLSTLTEANFVRRER